jgi:hypothetical protein
MNLLILQGYGPSPSLILSGYRPITHMIPRVKTLARLIPRKPRARRTR